MAATGEFARLCVDKLGHLSLLTALGFVLLNQLDVQEEQSAPIVMHADDDNSKVQEVILSPRTPSDYSENSAWAVLAFAGVGVVASAAAGSRTSLRGKAIAYVVKNVDVSAFLENTSGDIAGDVGKALGEVIDSFDGD